MELFIKILILFGFYAACWIGALAAESVSARISAARERRRRGTPMSAEEEKRFKAWMNRHRLTPAHMERMDVFKKKA